MSDPQRRKCKDGDRPEAACILGHRGQVLVTDVVFEGPCEGAFVAAMPWNVLATGSARWVLRRPVAGGGWNVEADESFVVGAAEGAVCEISWAGVSE